MSTTRQKLLIAASGTGGHLFPALAVAEQLPEYDIEWLGVPHRMEQTLVPAQYRLHSIEMEGLQSKLGLGTLGLLLRLSGAIGKVRQLLKDGEFTAVFSTGGYIAAPAIIAARSLGLPVVLHESNALPGKVTRWLSPWCDTVAIGFRYAAHYLPRVGTEYVGTPVRSQFLSPQSLDLPIPPDVPLIVVAGGSQGAVAVNQMVRECAPQWLEKGAWIVHLTGENDPDAQSFQHPQYLAMPFYHNMAGLLQRANLAISRAGAGTLTELAISHTPAILIPYPFAAEDHQVYNAVMFESAGAALVFRQSELSAQILRQKVLELIQSPQKLEQMAEKAASLAIPDSAEKLAQLLHRKIAEH